MAYARRGREDGPRVGQRVSYEKWPVAHLISRGGPRSRTTVAEETRMCATSFEGKSSRGSGE